MLWLVIETPEISYFIKEYLARLRSSPSAVAVRRLSELLDKQLRKRRASRSESSARVATFAAGQVAYYCGMLASPEQHKRLARLAQSHEEFWVRRAAAIGLAFGGDGSSLDGLIDRMWGEMRAGDFGNARRNIAIELGFYGDQEFNRLDPTSDRGGVKCERMLTQIARQLDSFVESPNWRMDLFDVLYVARNRPESMDDFNAVFVALRPRFAAWLEAAGGNVRLASCPEVPMLAKLVAERQERASGNMAVAVCETVDQSSDTSVTRKEI